MQHQNKSQSQNCWAVKVEGQDHPTRHLVQVFINVYVCIKFEVEIVVLSEGNVKMLS